MINLEENIINVIIKDNIIILDDKSIENLNVEKDLEEQKVEELIEKIKISFYKGRLYDKC